MTKWCSLGAALLAIALVVSGTGCERSSRRSSELVRPPQVAAAEGEPDAAAPGEPVQQPPSEAPENGPRELTWSFEAGPFGPTDVVVSVPPVQESGMRFPVLVALHGRGESAKGPRRGARGWIDDYQLDRAMARVRHPPLKKRDFRGFVSDERLRDLNRSLDERPYRGLIVVCPYLPDVLRRDAAFGEAERLASFIVDRLLPRVYEKTPAIGTAATTGIDGVSLGGRSALLIGFARPLAFGTIGALQAALDDSEIPRFTELAAQALAANPQLDLRLLTSERDYFRRVNERLSAAFTSRGVRHGYLSVQGTHSYRFNRGPGGLEMLLFHDRALRGSPVL